MQSFNLKTCRILALAIAGLVVALPALADRDSRGGDKHEKHGGHGQDERQEWRGGHEGRDRDDDYRDSGRHFDDRYRTIINNYYTEEFRSGRCPPGLAKKHNGCVPPGQKRWAVGRPLPRDVVYYDLPPVVVTQIGVPQPDYRYVRVANDVLMISTVTGLVIDAIQNLGGY